MNALDRPQAQRGGGATGRAVLEVALTGTFDVRNYGDLLFPLIARAALKPHGIAVRPVSPTGRDTGWLDCLPSQPLADLLDGQMPFDGVLIGGGNIIHDRPVTLPDYVAAGAEDWAYPGLWIGASLKAAEAGVPVVWNAPGLPWPLQDSPQADLIRLAAEAARHVSLRDQESAAHLGWPGATVVPDTVLGLARIWPREGLMPRFQTLLRRMGADPKARHVVVHAKQRSLDGSVEDLAQQLDAFAVQTGLVPILVAIGQCHGDQAVTAALAAAMKGPKVDLSQPLGLREIAAAIAHAAAYVGASMHGYITAAAYGVPGVIVGRPRLVKMAGLLRHLDRAGDEQADWAAALAAVQPRLGAPCPLPDHILPALDAHWDRVAHHLRAPADGMAAYHRAFPTGR